MRNRALGSTMALACIVGALSLAPMPAAAQGGRGGPPPAPAPALAKPGEWTGPRTPDGQPDVQGTWDGPVGGTFSIENPMAGGGRFNLIADGKPLPNNPSRVVDPSDGRIPYQAWAKAKQQEQEAHIEDPRLPQHIDTQTRCLLAGVARSFAQTQFRVHQFPTHVVLLFDQYQQQRIIRLGAPHIAKNIKLWMGDSVGHWEGNTLVVDVTNLNGKARLSMVGDFYSENAHVVERFTFSDANTATYYALFDDQTVYTRPWTMAIALRHQPNEEFWEYACHEGSHPEAWAVSKPGETVR